MQPLPPPPPRMPPATLALPAPYEDRLSDDFAFRSGRSGIGRSGIGWPATILMALAAGVVMIFAVIELRPDLASRAADTFRGTEAPATTESFAGATPATSPVPAGATAPQRAASTPGGAFGATPEPPTISVWSLPTAHAGQAPPTTPMAAFHAALPPPAPAPQRSRFVPGAAYAFNFNPAPPPPSLPPILAQAPAAAPAPPPPPVEEPPPVASKPFVMPKVPAAADEAPVAAPPTPAPAPKPAAPPPPPPKPHFAPGSLEDQIQKAVEADAAKKK